MPDRSLAWFGLTVVMVIAAVLAPVLLGGLWVLYRTGTVLRGVGEAVEGAATAGTRPIKHVLDSLIVRARAQNARD